MPTQRPGTRSGLAPSLRPRNLGATKDTRLPPQAQHRCPCANAHPKECLDPSWVAPLAHPAGRPRPPRRERLPRAGTGSRAGQVQVSAASAHRGPLNPLRTGGPRPPPGADAGAAAPPEGHLQAPRGTRDPRPSHLGAPDGGAQDQGQEAGEPGGARTRVGEGGRGTSGRPACPRPSRDPSPRQPPACRTWLAVGARTRGGGHEGAGADTDARARTRGHRDVGSPGARSGPGSCPARRRARGSPCRAGVGRRNVRGAVTWGGGPAPAARLRAFSRLRLPPPPPPPARAARARL
nr:PREDICTED: uncharacterized protein LOC109455173 [Rhinolophus sinicus]